MDNLQSSRKTNSYRKVLWRLRYDYKEFEVGIHQ